MSTANTQTAPEPRRDNYSINTVSSPELKPGETPNELRESVRELEVLGIVIVENNTSMRDKHEEFLKNLLDDYGEDYIIASSPNEKQTYKLLGGEEKPKIHTDLLLVDAKLDNEQGGLEIAEYANPMTNHTALHTTGATLETNKKREYKIPEYIDTAHYKAGENDLLGLPSYQKLLDQTLQNKEVI